MVQLAPLTQTNAQHGLLADLEQLIEGEVSTLTEDLTAVSRDFGGIVQKLPRVVVRPCSSADIAQTIKYASAQGLTVSSRAAGHSLNGQALNQDGILLDMRSLNRVHQLSTDQLWFQAEAGVTWQQIVDTALPQGVIPPVLTNNFEVTLGGTHSAAGLGQNSFRHGTQADNCLALEVVTGTGDVVWCSPEENRDLFYHALCGYGQFGIITQVKHRLRRYRPQMQTYFLCYDNLEQLLQDERLLALENRVDSFVSLFSPCMMGIRRDGEQGIRPLIEWFYRMQVTLEVDSVNDLDATKLLSELNFYRHIHTETLPFAKFITPAMEIPRPVDTANPWIDVLLPSSKAQDYIEAALARIPTFTDFRKTPVGSFCMTPRTSLLPMFPLPKDDLTIGFGIYPTVPKSQLQPVLEQLDGLTDLGFQMGGKRYLVSWAQFDNAQWQRQFGEYWPTVNQMKHCFDPDFILNPGFFQYDTDA